MAAGTGLTGKTEPIISLEYLNSLDQSAPRDALHAVWAQKWTWGTGANQANVLFHDQVTLTDGGNSTLDVYASGTLVDAFGNPLTLNAIKLLAIRNNSPDSALEVGGGASLDLLIFGSTSDKIIIPSGGFNIWSCPTAAGIVTTTNKNLLLTDDGTGAAGDKNIDVIILGLD
jgi:hypothetical protein